MNTRTFFTSDTHFGHKNVIKYCNRPFASVEEMDRTLIENWNAVVGQYDHVYHLGDFGLTSTEEICRVLKRLNGIKYFVKGNHDKGVRGEALKYFQWVKDYFELRYRDKNNDKQLIVLCHYAFESWNKAHHGSWHLHGHSHHTLPSPDWMRRLDAGVDGHNYTPISLEQVEAHMKKKVWKPIDHHGKDGYNNE